MNSGAFGENYPYSNFHDLNMDWIIKIAKDFLDQYTHIQQVIQTGLDDLTESRETGLEELNQKRLDGLAELNQKTLDGLADLQEKYDTLDGLLQAWYDTHSADIANQLADAITAFNTAAQTKSQELLDSWPADYSELVLEYNSLKTAFGLYVHFLENESYTSLAPITRTSVSVATGSDNIVIPNNTSLVKNFEADKTYFAYAEFTIANLTDYVAGNMYLQWLYTVSQPLITDYYAGTNLQRIRNGKIVLYGFFTSRSGQARPIISCRNTSVAYTLDITLEKLFLVETTENLSEVCAQINNSRTIYVPYLQNDLVEYANLSDKLKQFIPAENSSIIDCWGDSLTQGAGSTDYPYPTKLQELVGDSYTVNNYGQGSESAECIAFRQGGMSAVVDPFEIASGSTSSAITGKFINGADFGMLNISGLYNGDNRVYIDNNPFMFRRKANGTFKVDLQADTSSTHAYTRPQLMVAEGKGIGHIILICIGQNGWNSNSPNDLADIIELMVSHNNAVEYLVLGRPTGSTSTRSIEESVLADRFNEHFVNTREYISAYGLSDNSITPTTEDETAMSTGAIPPSLKSDSTHLNDYGYIALANCIYQRGKTLNYW